MTELHSNCGRGDGIHGRKFYSRPGDSRVKPGARAQGQSRGHLIRSRGGDQVPEQNNDQSRDRRTVSSSSWCRRTRKRKDKRKRNGKVKGKAEKARSGVKSGLSIVYGIRLLAGWCLAPPRSSTLAVAVAVALLLPTLAACEPLSPRKPFRC